MQPEEIIQKKEWQDLTNEERQLLQSLAADEQEYNLLKKMLMVADESAGDVPQVSPVVQQQLHSSLKKGVDKRWLYAAAVIVLVAVSAWLLLQNKKDTGPGIVNNPPPAKKEVIKKDSIVHRDTIMPQKPVQKINIKRSEPSYSSPSYPSPSYASISTLLKDDTTLMAFVTEVY